MRLQSLTIFALALATSATAQKNLLTNGGFDSSTAGWDYSSTLRNKRLTPTTITGTKSSSLQFEVYTGTALATLHQDLMLSTGQHRLRLFAGADVPPGSTIVVKAWVSNLRTNRWHLAGRLDLRNRGATEQFFEGLIDQLPKVPIAKDSYQVRIEFQHHGTKSLQPATCYLDGIEIALARFPMTSLDQVRSVQGDQAVLATWTRIPGAQVLQGVSLKRLQRPIVIPGFSGAFELDFASLIVVRPHWRSGTNWYTTLPVLPAVAKGLPFYAQSFSLSPAFDQAFGSSTWHAIH